MRKQFTIVCRGSWLSVAQAEIFKRKVLEKFPGLELSLVIKETAGDRNQVLPLDELEGKDFFTKDIHDYLQTGKADFAVHSLKDVSGEHFFTGNHYAIIERDDPRDVAIFNDNILQKINKGETIRIGTSSPRRALMALHFLKKVLPNQEKEILIEAVSIRGNVDTRLQKLNDKQYDGIILAVAGLNRLLNYAPAKEKVSQLLYCKKIMVLPFFECPPAPGQGAIVAEATASNIEAIEILHAINNTQLSLAVKKERELAHQYGSGCHQQFGAIHIDTDAVSFTYASGKDNENNTFANTLFNAEIDASNKNILSASDYMKSFFSYSLLDEVLIKKDAPVAFVASHKAIHSEKIKNQLSKKRIWAAGVHTWVELAKQGLWVEGCADELGLDFATKWMASPLLNILKQDIEIVTNTESAIDWKKDGWNAVGTYTLLSGLSSDLIEAIKHADIIFWTNFQQYKLCKQFLKKGVQHCCPSGKTARLFLADGIHPVIFPGIRAFKEWKRNNTILTTGK